MKRFLITFITLLAMTSVLAQNMKFNGISLGCNRYQFKQMMNYKGFEYLSWKSDPYGPNANDTYSGTLGGENVYIVAYYTLSELVYMVGVNYYSYQSNPLDQNSITKQRNKFNQLYKEISGYYGKPTQVAKYRYYWNIRTGRIVLDIDEGTGFLAVGYIDGKTNEINVYERYGEYDE